MSIIKIEMGYRTLHVKRMDKLIAHFDKYFEADDVKIFHPNHNEKPHIDLLLYYPTKKYPFWKLVTMGASDYKMPKIADSLSRYNEYMLFIDETVDMTSINECGFYINTLSMIASYPHETATGVSYGHSMEWEKDDCSDMQGAYLEMPQIIEDVGILRCKLSPFKTVACLQAVLLTKPEIDRLLEIGSQQFSYYLYPEDENEKQHYLSQQWRNEKF